MTVTIRVENPIDMLNASNVVISNTSFPFIHAKSREIVGISDAPTAYEHTLFYSSSIIPHMRSFLFEKFKNSHLKCPPISFARSTAVPAFV